MALHQQHNKGFTLIEMITVIIVLGIVSVGISGFIRSGVQIYTDATERDQLLGESRFVVERINRELRLAIPNSVRVRSSNSGSVQCLEFVPAQWATFYTNLPVVPESTNVVTIAEIAGNVEGYQYMADDFAIVYPMSNDDVYNLDNNKRKEITACSDDGDSGSGDCNTADDSGRTAKLIVTDAFANSSPASRLYIARHAVSYCVSNNGNIYRVENEIQTTQFVHTSGTLMAQNFQSNSNITSEKPFRVYEATLSRNSLVHVLLTFERNDEIINYSSEVHISNVP
jgi:MSHA biogenesis protein MshO